MYIVFSQSHNPVEVLAHVLFCAPEHAEARALSADAMEQLGYQSESATWRNAYLLAASELRRPRKSGIAAPASIPIDPDMLALLPLEKLLEYLAIRVHGLKAQALNMKLDWVLVDDDGCSEQQRMTLSNGALSHLNGSYDQAADARIVLSRDQLLDWLSRPDGLQRALENGQLQVSGNRALVATFLQVLDQFDPMFNVVEA